MNVGLDTSTRFGIPSVPIAIQCRLRIQAIVGFTLEVTEWAFALRNHQVCNRRCSSFGKIGQHDALRQCNPLFNRQANIVIEDGGIDRGCRHAYRKAKHHQQSYNPFHLAQI